MSNLFKVSVAYGSGMGSSTTCRASLKTQPELSCGSPNVEGGFCIAHHPSRMQLLIGAAAAGRVDLSGLEITEDVVDDLRELLVRDDMAPFALDCSRCDFASGARFPKTIFRGDVNVCAASFGGAAEFNGSTFMGGVNFANTQFVDAQFSSAHFCRKSNFNQCVFRKATFVGARFDDECVFDQTRWTTRVEFWDSFFGRATSFEVVAFEDSASFDRVTFSGVASFHRSEAAHWGFQRTTFGSDTRLGQTTSGAPIKLERVQWPEASILDLKDAQVEILDSVISEPLTVTSTATAIQNKVMALDGPGTGTITGLRSCVLMASLTFTSAVNPAKTSFVGTTGLDKLRFFGAPGWQRTRTGRQVLHDDLSGVEPSVVEPMYRELRVGLEASKASHAAADFYYGELECRRREARPGSIDWILLPAYKWLGGYGVRAWRPFAWYVAVVLGTSMVFRYRTGWFVREPELVGDGLSLSRYWDSVAIVGRSSVSFFNAPTAGLAAMGAILLIAERFAAISLLALAVVGLRSRVQR